MDVRHLENGVYKKHIALKSLWLFAGRLMPLIVLFLISVMYSRKLDYGDYGRYQSIWMYANLVNIIGSFGITSLLLSVDLRRFVAFIKTHKKAIGFFYSALFLLVVFLFYVFENDLATSTKGLLIALFAARNAASIGEVLLIKDGKEVHLLFVNVFYSLFFFAFHYYFIITPFRLDLLITAITALTILKCLFLFLVPRTQVAASLPENGKNILDNWFFFGFNDVFGVMAKWVDKLFLAYLLAPAAFAVYFNGSIEIPVFALLISVVGSVLLVEMAPRLNQKHEVASVFNGSFYLLSSIVFPLFFFLFFYSQELFTLLFGAKYNNAVSIFKISLLIVPLRITNYTALLQGYGQGKTIIQGSVLDLCISLLLMLLLFPSLGAEGIALAVVLGTYVQSLYYLWASSNVLGTSLSQLVPVQHLSFKFMGNLLPLACLKFLVYSHADTIRLFSAFLLATLLILINLYFYLKVHKHSTRVF